MNPFLSPNSQVDLWLSEPLTEQFFNKIKREIKELHDILLTGETFSSHESTAAIVGQTARIIGQSQALINTIDRIVTEMRELEHERTVQVQTR
jgi:hypothetical protein